MAQIKITGLDALRTKLASLPAEYQAEVAPAVYAAGDMIRVEAHKSIVKEAVQGKNHVPSSPGDPPNRDTGQLDSSLVTQVSGPLSVTVTANAPYAASLEFGTSKMAERPFMRPAIEKKTKAMVDLIAKAVEKACKDAGK